MKLATKSHRVELGENEDDIAVIMLREPTNKQWNKYTNSLFKSKGGKTYANSGSASAVLFADTVESIENLSTEDGQEVNLENFDALIPERLITEIIGHAFGSGSAINIKN